MEDAAIPIEILLVEDHPADVRLTREVLADGKVVNNPHAVGDGEEAMRFLRREGEHGSAPRPDVILLDLNLPKMDGREVLAKVKSDPGQLQIPVIALTTSTADRDIYQAYEHRVNAYITKPVNLGEFVGVVKSIELLVDHRQVTGAQ